MSVAIDKLLIVQLADWINGRAAEIPLPCPILVDDHEDEGEQLWLQPLAGTKITKRYTDGSYIGQFPFSVYYQLTKPEKMAALDVPLWTLGEYFEEHKPTLEDFLIMGVEMTATPAPFFRAEDGTFINQAVFQLTYGKDSYYGK